MIFLNKKDQIKQISIKQIIGTFRYPIVKQVYISIDNFGWNILNSLRCD